MPGNGLMGKLIFGPRGKRLNLSVNRSLLVLMLTVDKLSKQEQIIVCSLLLAQCVFRSGRRGTSSLTEEYMREIMVCYSCVFREDSNMNGWMVCRQ